MAVSKITELLGTKSLSSSDALFVYNSRAFTNEAIVTALGFSKEVGQLLTETPTTSTIDDFYVLLEATGAFETLQKEENTTPLSFTFKNNPLSVVSGYGFDTIIYLKGKQIIGFTVLLNPVGATITTKGQTYYSLSKNYTISEVHITISTEESNDIVSIDTENLVLYHRVESQAKITKPVGYTTDPTYSVKWSNYRTKINSLLKSTAPKEIFTDSSMVRCDSGQFNVTKLAVIKGITLDDRYKNLTNLQVGTFKGDAVLYLWSDKTYAILSLTKSVGEKSGVLSSNYSPITYTSGLKDLTTGKYISSDCMCDIPEFSEDDPVEKILGFQGSYAKVKLTSGETRIFDITRQGSPKFSGFPYDKGWVIKEKVFTGNIISVTWDSTDNIWKESGQGSGDYYENVDLILDKEGTKTIKEYEVTFLSDFILDSKGKLIKNDSWDSMEKAREDLPQITNTYADLTIALGKHEDSRIVQKIGEWIKVYFSESQTYLYTNMRTSVKVGEEELEPIVINDSTLVTVEKKDGQYTYTLHRNAGNFITKTLARRQYGWTSDSDITMTDDFIRGNWEVVETKELILSFNVSNFPDSPTVLGGSFLNRFRRNVLPRSLEGFQIIGAVEGLIFYKQANIVNLL